MLKRLFYTHLKTIVVACILVGGMSCNEVYKQPVALLQMEDSVLKPELLLDSALLLQQSDPNFFYKKIYTRNTNPADMLSFARSLMGTPYVYGATDPQTGFDCSGFITYVFNHFGIQVPRASISFTNLEKEIPLPEAKPGDIILFTGTDSGATAVGHMGIIEEKNNNNFSFIHATSGKAMGVTISPLDNYYKGRMVKVIRVFPDSLL